MTYVSKLSLSLPTRIQDITTNQQTCFYLSDTRLCNNTLLVYSFTYVSYQTCDWYKINMGLSKFRANETVRDMVVRQPSIRMRASNFALISYPLKVGARIEQLN